MSTDPIRTIMDMALSQWERLATEHAEYERLTNAGLLAAEDAEQHRGNFDYDEMKAAILDEATEKMHAAFERGV